MLLLKANNKLLFLKQNKDVLVYSVNSEETIGSSPICFFETPRGICICDTELVSQEANLKQKCSRGCF